MDDMDDNEDLSLERLRINQPKKFYQYAFCGTCGRERIVWEMNRCAYCEMYFCDRHAEEHEEQEEAV